jgi:hypothetical protein
MIGLEKFTKKDFERFIGWNNNEVGENKVFLHSTY